jgi:hypothetical protein
MTGARDPIATLTFSRAPRELARAAQTLAASSNPDDHHVLLRFLKSGEFRQRIDSPEEADTGPDDLWIARPLRTLESNPSPSARAALANLMADSEFTSDPDRVDLLVKASAVLWLPDPEVIRFWREFGTSDSVHVSEIMTALMDNGSPEAVNEFERIVLSTQPEEDEGDPRPVWLHGPMLGHRDNPHVIAMAERLVHRHTAPWNVAMEMATVESLFLHKAAWYRPHSTTLPPPRQRTPKEGRDTLRRIAEYVRNVLGPSPALQAGITATLVELDQIDDGV